MTTDHPQIEKDLEFLLNHTIRNNGQAIMGCLKQAEGHLRLMRQAVDLFLEGVDKLSKERV